MIGPPAPSPTDRVLVLAPHPDDETLATGGLLQRALEARAEVRVVFMTDGENNPWAQRATERRWRIGAADRERWGERRRGEALAALACLGVSPWQTAFLGFPDQGLHALLVEGAEEPIESLRGELERFRPTVLAAPSLEDLHPDHSALAVFVRLALGRLAPGQERPLERQFIVHHVGPLAETERTARLVLGREERERKRRAILCHGSQLRLRRRALLAFADSDEEFFTPGVQGESWGRHPVRAARVADGELHFEIARRSRPGACGAAELLMALDGRSGRRTLAARLPRGSGTVGVFDRAGGARVARAEVERRNGLERIVLPAALFAGQRHAFVKIERRLGFFDEAGWRLVPAPCPPAASRTEAEPVAEASGERAHARARQAARDSE